MMHVFESCLSLCMHIQLWSACVFSLCCMIFVRMFALCVGEEVKLGDISKPTLPSLLPKKPLLPKSSASSSSQPPRRPERPPTLASVHTQTHSDTQTPWYLYMPEHNEPNIYIWFTCSGVIAPNLRAGLRHQILPLTGHMTPVSWTDRSIEQWCSVRAGSDVFFCWSLICFCISGVCPHRYGSGRNCLFYGEAESSNGIAATSHGPPAPLTDHHTSESVCSRPVRNDCI